MISAEPKIQVEYDNDDQIEEEDDQVAILNKLLRPSPLFDYTHQGKNWVISDKLVCIAPPLKIRTFFLISFP